MGMEIIGVEGIEPSCDSTKNYCLATWRYPFLLIIITSN